jgi:hypothetical protein
VVPTEEERLPIRIPVSVRGLNTFDVRRPYPSLHHSTHFHFLFALYGGHASSYRAETRTLLTVFAHRFSLIASDILCTFLGQYRSCACRAAIR